MFIAAQVAPLFAERKALPQVPTYTVDGTAGLIAREFTAPLGFSTIVHEAPLFVER
jgi:hypothetical protein